MNVASIAHNEAPGRFKILGSNDGVNWIELGSFYSTDFPAGAWREFIFTPIPLTYLRIDISEARVPSTQYISVTEIIFYERKLKWK